jgi:hypothetical protein
MLVLGLVLILVSAIALVAALAGGSNDPATFDLGLFDVQTNTLGVFLLGSATVLLFVMGLELTRSGVRRANRRRKEQKEYQRLSQKYAEGTASDDAQPGDRRTSETDPGDSQPGDAQGNDPGSPDVRASSRPPKTGTDPE